MAATEDQEKRFLDIIEGAFPDSSTTKLDYDEFARRAILRLRDISKSPGIHTVFSGYNYAFRKYYGEDPIEITQELAMNGKIDLRPAKKGVMIYLPGEAPKSRAELGDSALSRILEE